MCQPIKNITIPNLLSCSRYLLAFPMAYLVLSEAWLPAAIVLWIAIGTDISDGYIARIRNQTTILGGFLDHSSDAFFVAILLFALAQQSLVTIVLPFMVVAAFLQYTFDSRALQGEPLRSSSLGRYNGISYFVLGGFPLMQHALHMVIIPDIYLPWISWGLVLSTAISMLDRLLTLLKTVQSASTLDE
jgi:phosphatidylglycerophosphate synthase